MRATSPMRMWKSVSQSTTSAGNTGPTDDSGKAVRRDGELTTGFWIRAAGAVMHPPHFGTNAGLCGFTDAA